jgi:hypothetical protein
VDVGLIGEMSTILQVEIKKERDHVEYTGLAVGTYQNGSYRQTMNED